ncbi:hypothetical protein CC1G_00353 [Coprinopsis cinerea okayama7|uniref:Uncharacterized protein n=1 Tax=Coprinopsis cinerea (strain Okayama-7 / 130 / ATCC MYA-4618 / FGSC 9003) TaxID=240176 RepID=A8NXN2_COPC7|nr:hypothetical protein CC1G_00353 [Coprinopsis cinerea okayama7\|eukprot:XP_001837217.2 hypothetical protein CC1G_00353 [Coprinopsis cinerea okayama7\
MDSPRQDSGQPTSLNDSPTSTFTASSSSRFDTSRSYRNIFASSTTTPTRQVVIRADPSLITCFDPADRELYDLLLRKADKLPLSSRVSFNRSFSLSRLRESIACKPVLFFERDFDLMAGGRLLVDGNVLLG